MGCIFGKLSSPHKSERPKRHAKSVQKGARKHHPSRRHADQVGLKRETQRQQSVMRGNVVKTHPSAAVSAQKVPSRVVSAGLRGAEERETREEKGQVQDVEEEIEETRIARYEFVEGWPKWLVDNIPRNVLATLVPKSADSYIKLGKVGRGTYSNVYKAKEKRTGRIVALKKVRFDTSDSESIKFMAREIMILQTLDHPNVIKLEGLATSRMQYSLYLVFEFMQYDLNRIISRPGERLTEPQIKCYMLQLLSGLQHCHERGVLHRDIKSSNLLVDKSGVLKIADFGLAHSFATKPDGPLTNRVVTLWYRAPELLLGSTNYGFGIDLWSAGCLLAEMFVGRPIMPGRTEVEQLHMIFKLCGSPSENYWRKLKLTTSYRPSQSYRPSYEATFQNFPSSSFPLLVTLLDLDPARRGSATSALRSEFFKSSPLACHPSDLPVIYTEEDDRIQKRRKGHRAFRKGQASQANTSHVISQSEKNQTAEQLKRESESSKEEKKEQYKKAGQETGNTSVSSTSSGSKIFTNEESTNASTSPIFSSGRKSPKTEAHPNALKNIKNYSTLLEASMIGEINHNEGNDLPQLRKSFSTLDFRLDPDKLQSLYGPPQRI